MRSRSSTCCSFYIHFSHFFMSRKTFGRFLLSFYIIHSILLLQQAEFEMRRQSSEATVARKSSAITLALVIRMSTWWCRQSAEKKMMRVREEGWPVFVIDVFVIELCAGLLSPLINNELLYAYVRG